MSAYLGDDDTADHVFAEFAVASADVAEDDHRRHGQAIATGRITVADEP